MQRGKRIVLGLFILCLYYGAVSPAYGGEQRILWKNVSDGLRDSHIETVKVSPDNHEIAYAGSGSIIYKTSNGGMEWNEVFSVNGGGISVHALAIAPSDTRHVFAGTDDGLYRSSDGGVTWTRIYKGIGMTESSVLTIAIDPWNSDTVYIGTRSGVYFTSNSGKNWQRGHNLPFGAVISQLEIDRAHPAILYAAADDGVYKSLNRGSDWKRIFIMQKVEQAAGEGDGSAESEDNGDGDDQWAGGKGLRSIAVHPEKSGTLYAASERGIHVTRDGGASWGAIDTTGLASSEIYHLLAASSAEDALYAATGKGVFRYSASQKAWEALYAGLTATLIHHLEIARDVDTQEPVLWAATKKGVFKTESVRQAANTGLDQSTLEDLLSRFAHEPAIEEIREAAIRYAEVHPEKIRRWRKAASQSAWLPDVRFSYDKDTDWQSDKYYYSGKYLDDDITNGKDEGWSISLTWELGELIWNSDQTSIDSRSRLAVQLRDDILSEVTRMYYERRRLQYQRALSPPVDLSDMLQQELRFQELSAGIDALTGSYLSERVSKLKARSAHK